MGRNEASSSIDVSFLLIARNDWAGGSGIGAVYSIFQSP